MDASVVWRQDPRSWERQVHRPVIAIGFHQVGVFELSLREANALRRGLDEVVMDIEEARTWL